jgi:hypothetical protein
MALISDVVKVFIGNWDGFPGHGSIPSLRGMFGHDSVIIKL